MCVVCFQKNKTEIGIIVPVFLSVMWKKIERETGEKIFSGEINGQKVAKRNRGSFNC